MRENWGVDHVRAMSEADYVAPASGEGELTETQAEAILNMRLRSLRRLEELELKREQDELMRERAELMDLLEGESSEDLQWKRIAEQLRGVRKQFGKDTIEGARRTQFAEAVAFEEVPIEAMIDKEPITVVCSEMGWIRAMTGHIDLTRELKFKDGAAFYLPCRDNGQTAGLWQQWPLLHCARLEPARWARHG
jgi:topoisomerase-4 subunit A